MILFFGLLYLCAYGLAYLFYRSNREVKVWVHVIIAAILMIVYFVALIHHVRATGFTGFDDSDPDGTLFLAAQILIPLPFLLLFIKSKTKSRHKHLILNIYILASFMIAIMIILSNLNYYFIGLQMLDISFWFYVCIFYVIGMYVFMQHFFPKYKVCSLIGQMAENELAGTAVYIFYLITTCVGLLLVMGNVYLFPDYLTPIVLIPYMPFFLPYFICVVLLFWRGKRKRKINIVFYLTAVTLLLVLQHFIFFTLFLNVLSPVVIVLLLLLLPIPYMLTLMRRNVHTSGEKIGYTMMIVPFAIISFTTAIFLFGFMQFVIIPLLIYTPFFVRKYY